MNVLRALDQLEECVEKGAFGLLGKKLVDEEDALAKFAVVRETIESALRKKAEVTPGFKPSVEVALVLDKMEKAISPGRGQLFGKRVIDMVEFFTLDMQLRVALPKSMKEDAQPPEKSSPTSPWS